MKEFMEIFYFASKIIWNREIVFDNIYFMKRQLKQFIGNHPLQAKILPISQIPTIRSHPRESVGSQTNYVSQKQIHSGNYLGFKAPKSAIASLKALRNGNKNQVSQKDLSLDSDSSFGRFQASPIKNKSTIPEKNSKMARASFGSQQHNKDKHYKFEEKKNKSSNFLANLTQSIEILEKRDSPLKWKSQKAQSTKSFSKTSCSKSIKGELENGKIIEDRNQDCLTPTFNNTNLDRQRIWGNDNFVVEEDVSGDCGGKKPQHSSNSNSNSNQKLIRLISGINEKKKKGIHRMSEQITSKEECHKIQLLNIRSPTNKQPSSKNKNKEISNNTFGEINEKPKESNLSKKLFNQLKEPFNKSSKSMGCKNNMISLNNPEQSEKSGNIISLSPSPEKTGKKIIQKYKYNIFKVGKTICLQNLFSEESVELRILKILVDNGQNIVFLVVEKTTNFVFCLKKCSIHREKPSQVHKGQKIRKGSGGMKKVCILQELIRQAKISLFLNHPNIIQTYSVLVDKNSIYLLMEFMQDQALFENDKFNGSLSSSLTKNRFSRSQEKQLIHYTQNILKQLLEALVYLHANGIYHRDIKPGNVFVSHNGHYKLGDFGSATFTRSQQFIGTLDYAAPEIILHEPYNEKIDIWSIGCVIYEAFAGRPPFFHDEENITLKNIIQCNYELGNITSLKLREILQKMLQKEKNDRESAKALLGSNFLTEQLSRSNRV